MASLILLSDHGGTGGRNATSKLERVPAPIARRLPDLFEPRNIGGETHRPSTFGEASRAETDVFGAERWRGLRMTGFEHHQSKADALECALALADGAGDGAVLSLHPNPVYPAMIALDRFKFESIA